MWNVWPRNTIRTPHISGICLPLCQTIIPDLYHIHSLPYIGFLLNNGLNKNATEVPIMTSSFNGSLRFSHTQNSHGKKLKHKVVNLYFMKFWNIIQLGLSQWAMQVPTLIWLQNFWTNHIFSDAHSLVLFNLCKGDFSTWSPLLFACKLFNLCLEISLICNTIRQKNLPWLIKFNLNKFTPHILWH